MMKTTLYSQFHGTEVEVTIHDDGSSTPTPQEAAKILCGLARCACGATPYNVETAIEETYFTAWNNLR